MDDLCYVLSYKEVPSFNKTREVLKKIKELPEKMPGSDFDVIQEFLKKYAVIIFHAEVELNLRTLFISSPILRHVNEEMLKSLSTRLVGEIGYKHIKAKFRRSTWNKVEAQVEGILKTKLNDHTFHMKTLKYDEFIEARNEISHIADTSRLIDENEIEKCIKFVEELICGLKNC
jgi:hypothetical protein